MQTSKSKQLSEPAQKLFRLDDRTVCTVAGLLSAGVPVQELYPSTSAIIQEYSQRLAGGRPKTIAEKLRELEFLFNLLLSSVANLRSAAGQTFAVKDYPPAGNRGRLRYGRTAEDWQAQSADHDFDAKIRAFGQEILLASEKTPAASPQRLGASLVL
jgi:hypothetical protein